MMYSKDGKAVMANTMQDHLDLKKKGYGHSKPSKAEKGMEYKYGGNFRQLD